MRTKDGKTVKKPLNPAKTWCKTDYSEEKKLEEFKRMYPEISIELIFQNLKKDAYGIDKLSIMETAKGISLHTEIKELKEVRALRKKPAKDKSGWIYRIMSKLNLTYDELELSGNRLLPSWLDTDV